MPNFPIEVLINLFLIALGWNARIIWVGALARNQEAEWFKRSLETAHE
jgi:hypothetical protein